MASDMRLRTIQIARRETRCRHGLLFPISSKGSFNSPSQRHDSTYHGLYGALAGMENSSMDPPCGAHGATGRRIDPSWGGPIELFLVPASAPHIKEPLLLITKSSPCSGGRGFPLAQYYKILKCQILF